MQDALWTALLERDFGAPSGKLLDTLKRISARGLRAISMQEIRPAEALPRSFSQYARMYSEHGRRMVNMKRAEERTKRVEAASVQGRYWRLTLDIIQFICGVGGLGVYPLVSMILLTLKLGGSSLNWWEVFLPCLGTVFHPALCAGIGAIVERLSVGRDATSCFYALPTGDTYNFVSYAAGIKKFVPTATVYC